MTSFADVRKELLLLQARLPTPDAALVDLFLHRLAQWLQDDSTAEELVADLGRTLGEIWLSSNENHATVALIIARLRDTVEGIGGMTMNERLFFFDLMDRWNQSSDADRDMLYKKLLANR